MEKRFIKNHTEQLKIIIGFVLLSFSIYLLFAFGSFLFNAAADQSKLQIDWWELVKNPEIKVDNITGKTGAWLADLFINRWFGLSSFLFIYLLLVYGLKLFNRKIKGNVVKTIKVLVLVLWLSVTLGYAFEGKYETTSIYPGGMYGYYIAVWLNSIVGKVGTFFILLVTLFIYLVFVFEGFINIFKRSQKAKNNPEGSLLGSPDKNKEDEKDIEKVDIDDGTNEEFEKTVSPIGFDMDSNEEETNSASNDKVIRENTNEEKEAADNPKTKTLNEGEDDLEMTVEMKESGNEEFENKPLEDYDPTLDLSHYEFPSIDLLEDYSHLKSEVTDEELIDNKNRIVETLRNFKIEIIKIKATIGPTVTLYEIIPARGIRISKIKNLEDDIALSLSALGIRIIAPIPGRGTIGIEVPNVKKSIVSR